MKHVIAFDVSKGKSNMVVYDHNQHCEYEGELTHTASGFQSLRKHIELLIEQDGQEPEIVFEATGVYSQGLEKFLQKQRYSYSRINPLEAKMQMAAMRRNKTDISDAHELAKTHFKSVRSKTYVQDEYYEQLRALGRYYDDLEQDIQHYLNRVHAFLQLSFPTLENVFSKKSDQFLHIVQLFPHSDYLERLTLGEVCHLIKQSTHKNQSVKQIETKAISLLIAAKNSFPAIKEVDVRCQHLRQYAKRIAELKGQKKETIKQMVDLSKERTDFQVLKSFPGIGKVTAVRIIAELGDIQRFKSNKQINAYVGIDIQRYQSGKTQYQDRINKRGNKRLRKILYYMIMSMLSQRKRTQSNIVDYYDHLKKQPQGKPHKVAVIACVNKFLKVAFHLIQHGILFNYESTKARS